MVLCNYGYMSGWGWGCGGEDNSWILKENFFGLTCGCVIYYFSGVWGKYLSCKGDNF